MNNKTLLSFKRGRSLKGNIYKKKYKYKFCMVSYCEYYFVFYLFLCPCNSLIIIIFVICFFFSFCFRLLIFFYFTSFFFLLKSYKKKITIINRIKLFSKNKTKIGFYLHSKLCGLGYIHVYILFVKIKCNKQKNNNKAAKN